MSTPSNVAKKRPSQLTNIGINVLFPVLVLNALSKPDRLGPQWALILALSLPLGYGIWEFVTEKKFNFVSVLGFISILLTGGLGLLQVDRFWFAVKEAAVPGLLALVTLGSVYTSKPLVKALVYNDAILDVPRIEGAIKAKSSQKDFDRLMFTTTLWLAGSFIVSSILNYGLARYTLKADPGTPDFNEQLATMSALSYPVIVLPSMIVMGIALWTLVRGIKRITGLELQEIMPHAEPNKRT